MAITAENLAENMGLVGQDADEYGYRSQTAWAAAHDAGKYIDEITPVTIKSRRGDTIIEVDEHPQLSPLAPAKF